MLVYVCLCVLLTAVTDTELCSVKKLLKPAAETRTAQKYRVTSLEMMSFSVTCTNIFQSCILCPCLRLTCYFDAAVCFKLL